MLHEISIPNQEVINIVIKGISQKDYDEVTKSLIESYGLSQSTISRKFIEESQKELKKIENRDLGKYDFIAMTIDGKCLSREIILIALGVTTCDIKIPLEFIQP